ncbi:acyl-CoA N-acyltransferase [Penicillium citrinum]|uniref:Acyl-CoA N-acyltransferase n=1 Tax=Penicillium citrinum TaxID=5077 RepID=A0A9W9P2I6_PENCI|nr:acyl-CoA N-acyltransferase [Penicillium citrinum]KAJ5234140.1 acyl-CoA N-acyltransferase [Penicillium citrinum]
MTSARDILIQFETESDAPAIEKVTSAAFMNAEHTDHNEQFIVRALREANQLSISLVAEDKVTNTVVGHVAISPVKISTGGSLLIERALTALQSHNTAGCVVLGNPKYYTRFGFKTVLSLQLAGVPPEYFMTLTWHEPTPTGMVSYHKAFEAKT